MKELKKLKLSKFTSELQKGQMRKLMGGASTDSFIIGKTKCAGIQNQMRLFGG